MSTWTFRLLEWLFLLPEVCHHRRLVLCNRSCPPLGSRGEMAMPPPCCARLFVRHGDFSQSLVHVACSYQVCSIHLILTSIVSGAAGHNRGGVAETPLLARTQGGNIGGARRKVLLVVGRLLKRSSFFQSDRLKAYAGASWPICALLCIFALAVSVFSRPETFKVISGFSRHLHPRRAVYTVSKPRYPRFSSTRQGHSRRARSCSLERATLFSFSSLAHGSVAISSIVCTLCGL